jgi:hypothetical protein
MTRQEFQECIRGLVQQCGVGPAEEDVAARMVELWEDLERLPVERLKRGIKLLIRRPDFKFFPSVGELLDAVNSAHIDSGEGWRGLSPARDDEISQPLRLMNDPAYRKKQRELAEQAAKDYFASPEHQELLRTMDQQRALESRMDKPPVVVPFVTEWLEPRKKRGRRKKEKR